MRKEPKAYQEYRVGNVRQWCEYLDHHADQQVEFTAAGASAILLRIYHEAIRTPKVLEGHIYQETSSAPQPGNYVWHRYVAVARRWSERGTRGRRDTVARDIKSYLRRDYDASDLRAFVGPLSGYPPWIL